MALINLFNRKETVSLKDVFTTIYKENRWNDIESASGPGSTLYYTENIRRYLPAVLKSLDAKSLLDAPCGDANWISAMDLSGISYTGLDIVPEMIEANKARFPDKKFMVADITNDALPAADVVICRDCFIHLPDDDIFRTLLNFRNTGIHYLVANTYPGTTVNKDIQAGDYRPLNLLKKPFNFSPPDMMIRDFMENYPDRYLGVWKLAAIALP